MPSRNSFYGWRPDKPDIRDYAFTPHLFGARKPVKLPDHVDLREVMCEKTGLAALPPVYNQGRIGSCTANAIAAAIQFDRRKQCLKDFVPSRLFIYYNEREMEGTVHSDSGAAIRHGIKVVARLGAPDEKIWPYDDTPADEETGSWPKGARPAKRPAKSVYEKALYDKALTYARVDPTERKIKETLASGFPIVFGFTVYSNFESDQVARTGVLDLPAPDEQMVGGHAVLAVGYTSEGRIIVRNSWGADWGEDGGFFTMPLEYATNRNLADDFWCISSVKRSEG